MVDPVDHRHIGEIERAYAFEARDVDAVLVLVRAAAMVRVDPAPRAEIMLRRAGVEPVGRQRLFAGLDRHATEIGRHRHRAAHPAIRAGAAARAVQSVGQFHPEAHGAAVARPFHFPRLISLHRRSPKLVSLYSMTSSARCCKINGTSRPSVFAVAILTTNSSVVGSCTGRSAGFAPPSILPVYWPFRR